MTTRSISKSYFSLPSLYVVLIGLTEESQSVGILSSAPNLFASGISDVQE